MRVDRGLALPVLAAMLALLLAAEWLLPESAAPSGQAPAAPAPAKGADLDDADAAQLANITLARPLLSPSRRPAASAAADEMLPRLSAIIVIGRTRRAIFATSNGKPLLVAEGGEIGPYRIRTVLPDKVDLLGPEGLLSLKPQFVSAAPQPAAAPP